MPCNAALEHAGIGPPPPTGPPVRPSCLLARASPLAQVSDSSLSPASARFLFTIFSPTPAAPSSFTVVPSAAQCLGGCTRSAAALDAKPLSAQHVPRRNRSGLNLRPTTTVSKASGAGIRCDSAAPCNPSACHREILSLHDSVMPGTFSASRNRANTTPGAGARSPRPAAPFTVVAGLFGANTAASCRDPTPDHSSFHGTSSTSLIANDDDDVPIDPDDVPIAANSPTVAGMEHEPHGAVDT
mmetsp:Transcript_12715/g.57743  ORF Transcript_12715/g.57743 Transcript_12715/m.57743 type:complete len:242 (-) Transcript_12715:866-1591(-)